MDEPRNESASPAQIEANRRNAQKSTGPRTEKGRSVAKMNALKHGILSRNLLVRGKKGRENRHELRTLLNSYRDHLRPVGPLEEMLVDQIVTAQWRLHRALRAESGEIALSVDAGHWQRSRRDIVFAAMTWDAYGDPGHHMRNCSIGNTLMENQLTEVRAAVERVGELTEEMIQNVTFRGKPYGLTKDLEELRLELQNNPEGLASDALQEYKKTKALTWINRRLRSIHWEREACEEHEENQEEAKQAAGSLPPSAALDKIMRYEVKLERQIYRAMNQLERLQRMRNGERVPPPLSMEVSSGT